MFLYRGPSIDASCQDLVHLAKQFQRRRLLEIDEPVTKIAYGMAAMFVNGLERNEQS